MIWYNSYDHLCGEVKLLLYDEGQLMETSVTMLYLFSCEEGCITLEQGHFHW
jgi:hypothetical protein